MKTVTVTRKEDELNTHEWRFYFNDCLLILDDYIHWRRETKRHKFVIFNHWDRLFVRNSTIELSNVPFPGDVATEARQQVIDQIKVIKEYKHNGR